MKKDKEKKESFLSMLFGDDDFKVNDKIFEDDDTTFNEIKDRTEELTNEIIDEANSIEDVDKEEIAIASSFPKLDRLGSVIPHKIK